MERLLYNLVIGTSSYANVTVIGPRGCQAPLPKDLTVLECPTNPLRFILLSTCKAVFTLLRKKHDIVVGGSGLNAPTLALLKVFFGVKTISLVHGLDLVAPNFAYQRVFIRSLKGCDKIIANSENTKRIAITRNIQEEKIRVVHPGVHIQDQPTENEKSEFIARHKIPFSKFILFTGRFTKRKGLPPFIEECLPDILSENPDIGLVIVGEVPDNAINKSNDMKSVLQAIREQKLEEKVILLGHLDEHDLRCAYATAHIQILPLVETLGDVEGFGMVSVEAAAQGTPTLGFREGGLEEATNQSLANPGDYCELTKQINHALKNPKPIDCVLHAKRFSWDKYHAAMREILVNLN